MMYQSYQQFCIGAQATGKYRQLPVEHALGDPAILDFSTNDYLGLSRHPAVVAAAYQAGQLHGVGATGSRLLSGNRAIFQALEERIAGDKGTDRALVFNSGFQANLTTLSSLLDAKVLGSQPLVFFDKLNHASLYQAVALSTVELVRYRHLDYAHLQACLARYAHVNRPKFIVTETLFGMDGDVVALDELADLAIKHHAVLYLDEAHAVGLLGRNGYGLSTGLDHTVAYIAMGTFSKALGGSGAYVACNQIVYDYLINKAPGFIYSTANSPMVMGAAFKAWEMLPSYVNEVAALFVRAAALRARLRQLGFNLGTSTSPIIPLIDTSLERLCAWQRKLSHAGIGVSLVRPPSVPPRMGRLRLALNITHTDAQINQLLRVLAA